MPGFVQAVSTLTGPDDYVLVWGCLPQLSVLANRRSPINWLSTNAVQMDPILPDWRDRLWRRMQETRPKLIVEADLGLDLGEVERRTGLVYGRGPDRIAVLDKRP